MNVQSKKISQIYQQALLTHLYGGSPPHLEIVENLGNEIRDANLPMLDFAKLHERILVLNILPSFPAQKQAALIRRAGNFFATTVTAAAASNAGIKDSVRLRKTIESLSGRTVELAATNRQLALEMIHRKKVEAALRKSERDLLKSLEKSEELRGQLRGLSRQIITAQEDERKNISRELHDVIAQALLSINVRLATLKMKARIDTNGLDGLIRNIDLTQRMIKKSTDIVHRFARKLRPDVLDDLGLIPALHSFMKSFTTSTGIRTKLTAFAGVEHVNTAKRIVLYRVAQEALNNVSRHAQASQVSLMIRKEAKSVVMEICDDGCSFHADEILRTRKPKRLGILGMRERVEMVGGHFMIESETGFGTKVIVRIPLRKATERKWLAESTQSAETKTENP